MNTPLAHLLKQATRSKGWSISRLADESGVNRSFISRLINGEKPPRTRSGRLTAEHDERYRRLAKALGLPQEQLIRQVKAEQLAEASSTEPEEVLKGLQDLVSEGWKAARASAHGLHLDAALRFAKASIGVVVAGCVDELRARILDFEAVSAERGPHNGFTSSPVLLRPPVEAPVEQRTAEKMMIELGNFFVEHTETHVDFDTRADLAGLCFLLASRKWTSWREVADVAHRLVEGTPSPLGPGRGERPAAFAS